MQDAYNGDVVLIKLLDDESWNAAKSELLSDNNKLLSDA